MVLTRLKWFLNTLVHLGEKFYAVSQPKGEIGGKTRLEQRNPAKTQAKLQLTCSYARPVSQS